MTTSQPVQEKPRRRNHHINFGRGINNPPIARWQLIWWGQGWRVSSGIWPKNREWGYIFRYWRVGPVEVRRFKGEPVGR